MKFPVYLDKNQDFPDTKFADNVDLIAIGSDLSVERLLQAYQKGIFPWFQEQPILWWSPTIRAVFITNKFYVSKSFEKFIQKKIKMGNWSISVNICFDRVIKKCTERKEGTWINQDMVIAYNKLANHGYAHSFELWETNKSRKKLIGGLYGVKIGGLFCGESMFSKRTNASKTILYALSKWMAKNNMPILDAQIPNRHLSSLGAINISRSEYESIIYKLISMPEVKFPDKLVIDSYNVSNPKS